jgi:putative lipoprotein
MSMLRPVAVALLLVLTPGCRGDGPGGDPPPTPPSSPADARALEPSRPYRGILTMGPGSRAFTPCGEPVPAWVEDRTGGELPDLYAQLASIPNEPIFAELVGVMGDPPSDGPGAFYPYGFEVTGIRQLSWTDEAPDCPEPEYGLVARGNEPSWWIRLSVDAVEYRTPDRVEALRLPPAVERSSGEVRTFLVTLDDGAVLELEIREGTCIDTMSGEVFPYTASLRSSGRTDPGCAWGDG